MLLQKGSKSKQPAFKEFKTNENSGGVMGMIEEIIAEAKGLEAEAIRGEEDAQKAYEDFVKESNNSMDAKNKDIINKSEAKGKAESELVESQAELESVEGDLESLEKENADLHADCDYTLKNFDLRQGARGQEIEALKQAKAILGGASFAALLQGNDVTPEMEVS